MSNSFVQQANRFIDWLREEALPFWARASIDPKGGFVEALEHDGAQAVLPRRLRVQSRQAYSFARADQLGLIYEGRSLSDRGLEALNALGRREPSGDCDQGYAHTLSTDGPIADSKADLYDHAFALLAAGERSRCYGDALSALTVQNVQHTLYQLSHDNGGWHESSERPALRRQNPHMHLFEAAMNLPAQYSSFQEHLLGELRPLLAEHFLQEIPPVIIEFFDADWTVHAERGAILEPGHLAEWAWLLVHDEPSEQHWQVAEALIKHSQAMGTHEQTGLLCNSTSGVSRQVDNKARLWPQTELARGFTLLRSRNSDALDLAADHIERLFKYYLCTPVPGGWFDEVDDTGQVVSTNMPSSTLYHLITLADEVTLALGEH